MARKRGQYQRRKERENKVNAVFTVLFFLFFTAIMIYGLVQDSVNVRDIDQNTLNSYTGEYEYRIKVSYGRHRRTTYLFTLGNGDTLLASKREIDHLECLDEHDELTFHYTTMYSNVLYGRYSAVSITTTDGEKTILDIDRSRSDSVGGIWLSVIMILLCLGLLVTLLVMSYHAGNWKRRYQKWRRKRRKMRAKTDPSQ